MFDALTKTRRLLIVFVALMLGTALYYGCHMKITNDFVATDSTYVSKAEAKTAAWAKALATCSEVTNAGYPGCIQRNYTDPQLGPGRLQNGYY